MNKDWVYSSGEKVIGEARCKLRIISVSRGGSYDQGNRREPSPVNSSVC
jgi:hypothetical protein